jgi:hypothetical protein
MKTFMVTTAVVALLSAPAVAKTFTVTDVGTSFADNSGIVTAPASMRLGRRLFC